MNILIACITTAFSAFIGTFFGALVLIKRQESKHVQPRKLLFAVLTEMKKFENKSISGFTEQFNNYSVIQKKAIIVPLKNLGIPIIINIVDNQFDLDNIKFEDKIIKDSLIDEMISFVNDGLCDSLFYKEVDSSLFNAAPKIIYARNLALQILDCAKTQVNFENMNLLQTTKAANMSWNQFEVIHVFYLTVILKNDGNFDTSQIDIAISNVKNGIFDHLFYWDIRAFDNMNSQNILASQIMNFLTEIQKNGSKRGDEAIK